MTLLRVFALVCVAITSIFVMIMSVWHTDLLSDPAWCQRIVQAAKTSAQLENAFGGCFSVFRQQLSALAVNSHVFGGVIALCLLALMVIVVAGGKLEFTAPGGIGGKVGANDPTPAQAAERTADAAVKEAATIGEQTQE